MALEKGQEALVLEVESLRQQIKSQAAQAANSIENRRKLLLAKRNNEDYSQVYGDGATDPKLADAAVEVELADAEKVVKGLCSSCLVNVTYDELKAQASAPGLP